jgi:hypothetical protein
MNRKSFYFALGSFALLLLLGSLTVQALRAQTVNTISFVGGSNQYAQNVSCVVNRVLIKGNVGGPSLVAVVTPPVPGDSPIVGIIDDYVILANGDTYHYSPGNPNQWPLVGNWLTEANLSVAGPPALPYLGLIVSPNPTRRNIGLSYTLSAAGIVEITLIDPQGRSVARMATRQENAGPHVANFDLGGSGGALAPGTYFVQVRANGRSESARAVILK